MPWKEKDVMSQKLEFVIRALSKEENFTVLCKEYAISTKTGYKWKSRFIKEGISGLPNASRRPKTSTKQIAEHVVCEIVKIKNHKKHWGPKKIRQVYADANPERDTPSLSSVKRILEKSGLVKKRKTRKTTYSNGRIANRKKPEKPNDLWTVDFKGWWYTPHKEKCEPLTVRDDFSKFILSIVILEKADISSVKREFERLFCEYGLPDTIRSDNGPPFASARSMLGLTKLAVWWLSLGIKLDRITPASPQENGGHERMHRDMKKELQGEINGDLELHQSVFNVWRDEFNTERPHESLNMKTPASKYCKSDRKYELFDGFEYSKSIMDRMVNDRGCINYKGNRIFICNAFNGFNLGIDPGEDKETKVYFGENHIGDLNEKDFLFTALKELKNKEEK